MTATNSSTNARTDCAARSKLGIRQPGWRPGMPVAAPDIAVPPAPGPPEQPGIGLAAGQVDNRQFDLSNNYYGPVLGDPDELRRQDGIRQDKGLAKVAAVDPAHH